MKKLLLLISSMLLLYLEVLAQKEANWWITNIAGISFESGLPIDSSKNAFAIAYLANQNSLLDLFPQRQGSITSTVSNFQGRLQFYNLGRYFFNQEHQFLKGADSTVHVMKTQVGYDFPFQHSLFVPRPGYNDLIDVFTSCMTNVNQPDLQIGFFWHRVNMALEGGLGRMTVKNIPFGGPVQQWQPSKLTAIRHANGVDFWVIAQHNVLNKLSVHYFGVDSFNTRGVDYFPGIRFASITNSGGFLSYTNLSRGTLKGNLQGTKLVFLSDLNGCVQPWAPAASTPPDPNKGGFIQLYDFDKSTGNISNTLTLYHDSLYSHGIPTQAEFSPSGQYLYVSAWVSFNHCFADGASLLLQYDLSSWNSDTILASRKVIDSAGIGNTLYHYSALQVANNGKLYVGTGREDTIHVINHPDSVWPACNFQRNALVINISLGIAHFPNFFPAFHGPNVWIEAPVRQICKGDTITLTAKNDTAFWWSIYPDYNDTISTDSILRVSPNRTTIYIVHGTNGSAYSVTIEVFDPAESFLPPDTSFCANTIPPNLRLSVEHPLIRRWQWSTGDTTESILVQDTGWIFVSYDTDLGCDGMDSTYVFRQPNPQPNLGPDTTLCDQTAWVLDAGFHGGTYRWSPCLDSTQTKTITELGTYRVHVTDSLGCRGADTIRILQGTLNVSLGQDTVICPREPLLLLGNPPGKRYNWSTGVTTDSIRFLGPGLVQLIAQDGFCTGSAAKRVNHLPAPPLEIEADTSNPCTQQPITVRSLHGAVQWYNGILDTSIVAQPPVWVWAQVQDSCYTLRDSLFVEGGAEPLFPNVITPNGDGQNDKLSFIEVVEGEYNLEVYNRWGRRIWQSEDAAEGWEAHEVPAGTYNYSLRYRDCTGTTREYMGWVQVLK